jgi:hypothetical protein
MNNLTKEKIVQTWFFSGLEDIFVAFQIDSPFPYEPFMNTMGFEKICRHCNVSDTLSDAHPRTQHREGEQDRVFY